MFSIGAFSVLTKFRLNFTTKRKKWRLNVAFHLLHLCVTLLVHFLQNLCVVTAYRPVHQLLEEEKKVAFPCEGVLD